MSKNNHKIAIVPGSFDPMTLGHRALVEQVCQRYQTVYVAVMTNFAKQPRFDSATRCRVAEATLSDLPNVKVIADEGLLVDLFERLQADVVCKGYRNEVDIAYEKQQDAWNREHDPRFCTELIAAEPGTEHINSTAVRERLLQGETLTGWVAEAAIPVLQKAFFEK